MASKYAKAKFLSAFALGVYLWYFTDTLGGANYLDVNGGLVLSGSLLLAVALFAIGLLTFFALDGRIFTAEVDSAKYGMIIAAMAALALGLHGAGEGADFGYIAATTPSSLLLGAFGGTAEAASWVLHKMLEPTMVAACYVAFADVKVKSGNEKLVDAFSLAAVFVIPAIVGSILGYYTIFDHSYIFALGLGASVFALARLAKPMFAGSEASPWLSPKMAFAAFVGFLLIFIAALLHS